MKNLVYIERLAMAVLLLLLLALAPARAQMIAYVGETTTLAVDSVPYESYKWDLYNESTVNYAIAEGTAIAEGDALFVGSDSFASVKVNWLEPGIYFFKVTALNADGCTNNLKVGFVEVLDSPPTATLVLEPDNVCLGEWASLQITLTGKAPWKFRLRGEDPLGNISYQEFSGITDPNNPLVVPLNPVVTTLYTVIDLRDLYSGQDKPLDPVKLTIHPIPDTPVAAITVSPTCNNLDGTVVVSYPTGDDLMYSIDGGTYQASTKFENLKWGDHSITVKNILTQCVSPPFKVKVPPVPPAPLLTATWVNPICFGQPGRIIFTVVNFTEAHLGTGNFTIQYEGGELKDVPFTAGKSAPVMAYAGNYRNLVLTNPATSCNSYDADRVVNVNIIQPGDIVIETDSIIELDLKSPTNGAIYLRVTGGSGNYLYRWSNGATSKDITRLTDGSYTVTIFDDNGCPKEKFFRIPAPNYPPLAVADNFLSGCKVIKGNVLDNDTDPENDPLITEREPVVAPLHGTLNLNDDGSFVYLAHPMFSGIDSFVYVLYDKNKYEDVTGTVTLTIIQDMDGDGLADDIDPDADGDGILNIYEALAGEDWLTADRDSDGLFNWLDIDSDGDGIVDNIEAQSWEGYKSLKGYDADSNGIDDAYDGRQSGYEISPVDTDGDGIPDFLDLDSDGDGVPDAIEGHDKDVNGKPDWYALGKDADGDGLDDAYDTVFNDCGAPGNALGGNALLPDFEGDGIPDWRDEDDDNDKILTKYEDLNGDKDWSNDDMNFDGIPEYLDPTRECDLFIPNAFSPNGDNVHDYFQVYCINHFPDAKLYIFDQMGNKLYERTNYGNLDVHKNYEDAWWSGRPNTGPSKFKDKLVDPGTYYYVLDLGNGEVKKSFVFVSY